MTCFRNENKKSLSYFINTENNKKKIPWLISLMTITINLKTNVQNRFWSQKYITKLREKKGGFC